MSRASQAVTGGPHLEWESIAFLALDVGRTKKWAPHSFACFANEWEGHNPTEVRVTVTRESLCLRSAFFHVEVVRIPLIAKNAMSGAPGWKSVMGTQMVCDEIGMAFSHV